MWDTVVESATHLSHEMPCPRCGHSSHSYLPCSDRCDCPGSTDPHQGTESEDATRAD